MSSALAFVSSPFNMPYDTPLNLPPSLILEEEEDKDFEETTNVPYVALTGHDWADGTCTTDPVAWEYWVWEKHIDYRTGHSYYYSPHYDISTYDIPEREGPAEEYEDVVIKDCGATIWQKLYRKRQEYPHYEPYYYCKKTGKIVTTMPTRGYVQVVREYETIDNKGVRRNYTSVQFPKLPPLNTFST
jgi:hypothetical protein